MRHIYKWNGTRWAEVVSALVEWIPTVIKDTFMEGSYVDTSIQALLDRAYAYKDEVCTMTGVNPEYFGVSEDDYRLLQVYYGGPQAVDATHEIQVFGMRVWRPIRSPWYPGNRSMNHIKAFPPTSVYPSGFLIPSEICTTELPETAHRAVLCPCGQMIWDMYSIDRQRLEAIPMFIAHERSGVSQETDADPLPPLDDMDEGLECCYHRFETHAAFMAHRRLHREA